MKHRLTLLLLALATSVSAQIAVDVTATADDLAQSLAGPGVTIDNAVLDCPGGASGIFTGLPAGVGITDGVILTSGQAIDIDDAPDNGAFGGPPLYDGADASTDNFGGGDPDLDALVTLATQDACYLEFDIFVLGDTLKFDYVFSSEEYNDFVCAGFNDVFAFFLESGPIPGGGAYAGQNIAIVPGTGGTPVSIDNVHNGDGAGGPAGACGGPVNPIFFNGAVPGMEFDGNTVVLQAIAPTVPCNFYRLKMAVADVGDGIFDSGVFLSAGSFTSPGAAIAASSVVNSTLDFAVEGCVDGQFTFTLRDTFAFDFVTRLAIGGTATNGTDYVTIPDSIVIPSGDTSGTILIQPFLDGISEGFEEVTIYALADCDSIAYDSATLRIFDSIPASISNDDTICTGQSTTLFAGGADTVRWAPATGLSSTIGYTVTATPATTTTYTATYTLGGCVSTDSVTVFVSDPDVTLTSTPIPCGATSGATLTANVTGAIGDLTYDWTPAGPDTATLTGLGPGLNVVSVSDAAGCTDGAAFTIPAAAALSVTTTPTDRSCSGAIDGAITLGNLTPGILYQVTYAVNGGTPVGPAFITSDPAGTIDLTGLDSGSYAFDVIDTLNACQDSAFTSVGAAVPAVLSLDSTDVSCAGGSDGSAWVIEVGGTPPFTYLWDDPASQTTDTASNLSAGTYHVTVSDALGCVDSLAIDVNEPPALTIALDSVRATRCFGEASGGAFVTASGGTPGYDFAWSTGAVTEDVGGLTAGTHCVTVTDANGCVDSICAVVPGPDSLGIVLDADSSTCLPLSGQAYLDTVFGGTTPYSVLWNDPGAQTTDTAFGLNPGTYTVTLTDDSGCVVIDSIEVAGAVPLTLAADSTNPGCFGDSTGVARTIITTGTPPFTFLWSDGSGADTLAGLPAGPVSVTVTDGAGCTDSLRFDLTQPPLLQIDDVTADSVTCFGDADGSATVTTSGGTPGYDVAWSSGDVGPAAPGLATGDYSVTVTDANGCITIDSTTVDGPPALVIDTAGATDATCFGATDGDAVVLGANGTPGYTYAWSDGSADSLATGLGAGTYTATLTDARGCTVDTVLTVGQPARILPVIGATIDASCVGSSDGSITVIPTNGSSPFVYAVGGTVQPGDSLFTGLPAGSGHALVTDADGCVDSVAFTIDQPTPVALSLTATDATCFGAGDGIITASASGGTPGYVFGPLGGPTLPDDSLDGLAPGTYNLFAEDANGCRDTASATIDEPTPVVVTPASDSVSCAGDADGVVTLTASGGTPGYDFGLVDATDTLRGGPTFTDLVPGNYQGLVEDANGCADTSVVTVLEPLPDTFAITAIDSTSCFGTAFADGAIFISGGPNGPYTYSLVGRDDFTPSPVDALPAALHDIATLSASGCRDTLRGIAVPQPPPIILSAQPADTLIELGTTVDLSIAGEHVNLSNASIAWTPSDGLDCDDCIDPVSSVYTTTEYQVTVVDEDGCSASITVLVQVGDERPIYIPNAFTPNADGMNDRFRVYGEDIKSAFMSVYDRWGEELWRGEAAQAGWDGTFQGAIQPPGVYTYVIEVTYLHDARIDHKGSLTLIR